MGRLFRESIWHPDAISPTEWKYRSLKRIWLPAYDFLAIFAGVWAAWFGSPVLHRLFPNEHVIDVLGIGLAVISLVCLLGVVFPRFYVTEIIGKIVLVALLASYAGAIVIFNTSGDITSWFVAFIVSMTLPLPLFRLSLLGEEIKERHDGGT